MDRREFIAAAGTAMFATLSPATRGPILTFARNGISLPFYENEMPPDSCRDRIRGIFYDLDSVVETAHSPCYRFPVAELDRMLVKPFRWDGWFGEDRFHLLQAGISPGRYEYCHDKVCMFEREMYSGGGRGLPRDRCLLAGPYEPAATVNYHQAKFKVFCDSYWTTTLPGIGCVVRWRYKVSDYQILTRGSDALHRDDAQVRRQ